MQEQRHKMSEVIKMHFSLLDIDVKISPDEYIFTCLNVRLPFMEIRVGNNYVEIPDKYSVDFNSLEDPNINLDKILQRIRDTYREKLNIVIKTLSVPPNVLPSENKKLFRKRMKDLARAKYALKRVNKGL